MRRELGAHIDGYVSMVGETIVVGAGVVVSDVAGRAIQAAIVAAHAALHMLRPGVTVCFDISSSSSSSSFCHLHFSDFSFAHSLDHRILK
jgi:hypothetical protein